MKKILLILFSITICLFIYAEIPAGYYNNAHNKKNAEIKTGLHQIIRDHTYLNYGSSAQTWWNDYFRKTDWHPDGYFWDMYSNEKHAYYNYQENNQEREHCMPRSWWGSSGDYGDANGELFNLYPSDGTANGRKSNNPLGVVETARFDNEVVKVGTSALDGYTGTVFEPADEYKGDFARTYMYMVTCYEDYTDRWKDLGTASMLENNTYPTFNEYAVNLLMKWHTDDPVSEKELDRNEVVYHIQGNRNPFIDLPEIAEYIWGSKVSETWEYWVDPISLDYFAENKYSISLSHKKLSIHSIKPEEIECRIYSMEGKFIKHFKTETNSSTYINLQSGFYVIEIKVGNNLLYEKIFTE